MLEVGDEGAQPALGGRIGERRAVQRLQLSAAAQRYAQQHAGVLAGELVGGLAQIHRRVALLFVEVKELFGQPEAHAQPLSLRSWKRGNVEALGAAVGERDEERGKVLARAREFVERGIAGAAVVVSLHSAFGLGLASLAIVFAIVALGSLFLILAIVVLAIVAIVIVFVIVAFVTIVVFVFIFVFVTFSFVVFAFVVSPFVSPFALLLALLRIARELDLSLEVLPQQLQRAAPVAHSLHVGVRRDPHDPRARQLREIAVQELPRDDPRDEIAGGARALLQLALDGGAGDGPLEADLRDAVDVGERPVLLRREEDEEHVRGRVGEQLEVVGGVLVVRGDVERPDAVEKGLGELVVAEEGVAVDEEELAGVGVRRSGEQPIGRRGAVEAEERVQPALHGVVLRVANGLRQLDLAEGFPRYASATPGEATSRVLPAQLVDELERERAAGALIAGHRAAQEDHEGAQQLLHEGQRDGGGLVDDAELRLRDARRLAGVHELHHLPVRLEDVHAHHQMRLRLARRVDHLEVRVLRELQRLQPLHHEREQRLHVLRRRRRHEHAAVPEPHRARHRQPQRRRLPLPRSPPAVLPVRARPSPPRWSVAFSR